jgi:hypothetical protein
MNKLSLSIIGILTVVAIVFYLILLWLPDKTPPNSYIISLYRHTASPTLLRIPVRSSLHFSSQDLASHTIVGSSVTAPAIPLYESHSFDSSSPYIIKMMQPGVFLFTDKEDPTINVTVTIYQ